MMATKRHRASDSAALRDVAERNESFDFFDLQVRNRDVSSRLGKLPGLLAQAFRTVYQAAPGSLTLVLALTVLGTGVSVGQVLASQRLLVAALRDPAPGGLTGVYPWIVVIGVLVAVGLAVTTTLSLVQRVLSERTMRDMQRRVLATTVSVPLSAYETPWFFNYLARIETNAVTKPVEIVRGVIAVTSGIAASIGLGSVILTVEPLLVPLLVLAAVPVYVTNWLGGRQEFRFAVNQSEALRERTYLSLVLKLRETAKEVRAYELARVIRPRWERRYKEYIRGLVTLVRTKVLLGAVGAVATGALIIVAMIFLVFRIAGGQIGLADAGAALIATRLLSSRLQSASSGTANLFESRLFLQDLEGFFALRQELEPAGGEGAEGAEALDPPAVPDQSPDRSWRHRGFAELSVEDVRFVYPGSDVPSLEDVNLTVRRGEFVAIVGENGSGKTTLAKLICGLYTPTSGSVRWDGHALADVGLTSVRRDIATVFQDFARYELSADENIHVGRAYEPPDRDEVVQAADRAGARWFLEALPHGYDTRLSKALPGGADLSLGQWQRVALARAFYRDAPLLVLDEPSSALDPRAEQSLFDTLRNSSDGKTVILISHRLTNLVAADRIVVMHQGRIVESGTHEALLEQAGRYHELFRLQSAAYGM